MNELDTLRPEVADAVSALDETTCMTNPGLKWYATIRAELLRLARNDADARIALDADHDWKEMYERAKKAEAELAAVKARIADAPVAYLTSKTGVGPCNVASMAHGVVFDSSSYGKSVRVVLDE